MGALGVLLAALLILMIAVFFGWALLHLLVALAIGLLVLVLIVFIVVVIGIGVIIIRALL